MVAVLRVAGCASAGGCLVGWPVVPVVSSDLPVKQDVFHLWTSANVVNNHVTAIPSFPVDDNSDVWDIPTQIPRDHISWVVIGGTGGDWQGLSVTLEERHQVGNAPMINIGIRMSKEPFPFSGIARWRSEHILVNFLLQVDADCAISADDFIATDPRIGRDVTPGIRNTHVGRIITNDMMSALDGSSNQSPQKLFLRGSCGRTSLHASAGAKRRNCQQ